MKKSVSSLTVTAKVEEGRGLTASGRGLAGVDVPDDDDVDVSLFFTVERQRLAGRFIRLDGDAANDGKVRMEAPQIGVVVVGFRLRLTPF